MYFAVRVPGATDNEYIEFPFLDDTGADNMLLFKEDVDTMTWLAIHPGESYIRRGGTLTAGGWEWGEYHKLEVAILQDGQPVTDWVTIKAFVKPGSQESNNMPRLSGMWMRRMVYIATAPDNTGRLFLSTTKAGLERMLPDVDAANAEPLVFSVTPSEQSNPSSIGSVRLEVPYDTRSRSASESAVRTPAWDSELRASVWDSIKRPASSPAVVDGDDSPVWVQNEERLDDINSMDIEWNP